MKAYDAVLDAKTLDKSVDYAIGLLLGKEVDLAKEQRLNLSPELLKLVYKQIWERISSAGKGAGLLADWQHKFDDCLNSWDDLVAALKALTNTFGDSWIYLVNQQPENKTVQLSPSPAIRKQETLAVKPSESLFLNTKKFAGPIQAAALKNNHKIKELNGINIKELGGTLSEKFRKPGIFANCFALASPISPLAMLSAFFMLDKLEKDYEETFNPKKDKKKEQKLSPEQMAMIIAAYRAQRQKEKLAEKQKAQLSIDMIEQTAMKARKEKATESSERKVAKERKTESVMQSVQNNRSQNAQKVQLSSLQNNLKMQRLGRVQNYGSACRMSARIELIEKALRQTG